MATAATIDVLLRANTATYRAAMVDAARVTNQQMGRIQAEVKQTAAVMSQLRTTAAGIISVQALRSTVGALLDVTKQNQALVNSMKASTGSAALSADALSFVSQAAKELGLDYQSAAEGFQRMTASATANGIAMKDQQQLFLEVSRAATSMQIAPAQVDRAMTALSQSFSKGRFQAEELRQQLAEAIPGVVPRFQKAVGELTKGTDLAGKSFDQLLQGGLLDVKTFLPAMTQAFAEMGTTWQDGSRGIQAETNRLGNAWRKFKLDLADGVFGDTAVAGIKAATVALEGMGAVMPVLVPAVTALAAVKLGQSTAEWVRGLNASYAAMLAQKVGAEQAAAGLVQKTRAEMIDAQATAARARAAYGGSIAADVAALSATNAHTRALAAHAAAQEASAIASNRLALAGRAALGFFGGPAGLAFMVASTAASWLIFRDNTKEAQQALIDWNSAAGDAVTKFYELNKAQQSGEILKLQQEMQANAEKLSETIANMALGAGPSENIVSENDLRLATEYANAMRALQSQWEAGKISADELSNAVDAQNKKLILGSTDAQYFATAITEQGAAIGTTSREIQKQQGYLDAITGKQYSASAAARDHAAGMIELSKASQEATTRIQAALASLPGQIERIGKSAKDVASLDVRDWFRQLAKDGVNFADQNNEQVKGYLQQGTQFIQLQTKLSASQEAYNNQQKAARAGARESATAAKQQENQYQTIIDKVNRQIALDKEAMLLNDDMTAAQKLQVVITNELASAKNKLSDAEQVRVRALLDEAVAQGLALKSMEDAKKGAEDLLRLQNQLTESLRTQEDSNTADLTGINRGGDAVERMRRQVDIQREYQRQVESLNLQMAAAGGDKATEAAKKAYQDQMDALKTYHEAALASEEAYQQQRTAMQADWTNGLQKAVDDFVSYAANVADRSANYFSGIFDSFSSGFEEFITGSKSAKEAFGDFADYLFQQSARMVADQLLGSLLKGFSGTGGSGAGGYGEAAGSIFDLFSGGWGFKDGGYTGPGGSSQPAGVVHRGEVVWSQKDVLNAGGVAVVEAMRRGIRGYADGGEVGGSRLVRVTPNGARWGEERQVGTVKRIEQKFYTMGIESRRTQQRKAQLSGREAQRALARDGV